MARPERLDDDDISTRLGRLPGWEREGDEISKTFELPTFPEAIAFVTRIADRAEAANHHPDILLHGWNKVRLTLSTHSAGAVTQADHDLAAGIDGLGVG